MHFFLWYSWLFGKWSCIVRYMNNQTLFRNTYRIKSTRLPERDYRNVGAYFVTFNIKDRKPLFGNIVDAEIILSEMGEMCNQEIIKTWKIRENVEIDAHIVMPDHVHVIVMIIEKITTPIKYDIIDDVECDDQYKCANNMSSESSNRTVETARGLSLHDWLSMYWIQWWIWTWSKTKKHHQLLYTHNNKNTFGPQPPWSLQVIINQMKWSVTRHINKNHPDIWFSRQSGYYDRIIRSERELRNVRRYIFDNPRNYDWFYK